MPFENRKDFSFSEKMQWAEQLKKEYEKIARINQLSGLNNQSSSDKYMSNDKIDSNKQIAEDVNLGSKETYRKSQYIYNNGSEDLIKQLDDGQLSKNSYTYTNLTQSKVFALLDLPQEEFSNSSALRDLSQTNIYALLDLPMETFLNTTALSDLPKSKVSKLRIDAQFTRRNFIAR